MNAVAQAVSNGLNQANNNQILLPPGRIVQGDLYEPQTEDMQGNKLLVNSGANKGQPRVNYFFAVAIPKTGEQIWWQTAWGGKIYQIGMTAFPTWFDAATGQCRHPKFSWKVSDGDDTTPNPDANMRRNCDREGFPGHWVVRLGSGFATKIVDDAGNALLQPGLVKRGWWVEVLCSVSGNDNAQKPGLYINHQIVAYRAPDKEISSGPDPRQVGFGRAALPSGITAQPIGNVANMPGAPAAAAPMPGAPAVPGQFPASAQLAAPGAMPPAPGGFPGAPAATPPAPTAVQAHPGFLQPPGGGAPALPAAPAVPGAVYPGASTPGVPSAPPLPGAAPAAPAAAVVCPLGAPMGYKMANLNGPRYEAFRAQNWPDAQLIAQGHMVKL